MLREGQIGHANETAGRPVLSHVFLEQPDDGLEMPFRVSQIDLHINKV